jgi:Short C-terminal domain
MIMRRRRPLLRTAAIGGVAYAGAKAGTNRANRQQAQSAAPADAPAPAQQASEGASDRISQLQQLAALHDSGALTDEEFAKEKARVLG